MASIIKGLGQSQVMTNTKNMRLSSLYGWRVDKTGEHSLVSDKIGLRFVDVDMENPAYTTRQAALGSIVDPGRFNTTLGKYLDLFLGDVSLTRADVNDRVQRLGSLDQMIGNDTYISASVRIAADEATQVDSQSRLISIKSNNPAFIARTYQLLAQWGITKNRVHSTIEQIESYGEAFWGKTVTERGIEKIYPLSPYQVKERIEFNPIKMAELRAHLQGDYAAYASRSQQIKDLIDSLEQPNENIAQIFEKKLFGYRLDDNIIVPPWQITHFRYNADGSSYTPYGEPPLVRCLGAFRQAYLAKALQGLARVNSFPIKVYTVKTTAGLGTDTWREVNDVRMRYQNIGLTPGSNALDAYTVNTEVWCPNGLVDLKVFESKIDFNFVDDIKLYDDAIARGALVPRAYVDQLEHDAAGQSGVALVKQFKPFGNHVYSLQTAFLEELGNDIRLHYAITGEFDYNTQFVLEMNFPATATSTEQREAQNATLEQSNSIIELLQKSLGLSEDDPIPEEISKDVLSRYTFLDPTDLERWFRIAQTARIQAKANKKDDDDEGSDNEGGGFGGGSSGGDESFDDMMDDLGGDESGGDEGGSSDASTELSDSYHTRHLSKYVLTEGQQKRLKETRKLYEVQKEDIFFEFLNEQHITEWSDRNGHSLLVPTIDEFSPMWEAIQAVAKKKENILNENEEVPETDSAVTGDYGTLND